MWHLAAPCPPWLKEEWINWLGAETIWELYGGTEAQAATIITGAEWMAHRGSVGKVNVNQFKVLRADGTEADPGEVGEVFMRPSDDENVRTYRYVGAEARRIEGGWESLGDMGAIDADGYLYLSDRQTDMILAGGANIYPAEIEAALDEHPRVRSCAVIGLPDDDLGNRRARDRADRRRHADRRSTSCARTSPNGSSATRSRARSSSRPSRCATTRASSAAPRCGPSGCRSAPARLESAF